MYERMNTDLRITRYTLGSHRTSDIQPIIQYPIADTTLSKRRSCIRHYGTVLVPMTVASNLYSIASTCSTGKNSREVTRQQCRDDEVGREFSIGKTDQSYTETHPKDEVNDHHGSTLRWGSRHRDGWWQSKFHCIQPGEIGRGNTVTIQGDEVGGELSIMIGSHVDGCIDTSQTRCMSGWTRIASHTTGRGHSNAAVQPQGVKPANTR
jgi:hypothetical protein